MADKPSYATGYQNEQVSLVRATCLYVATRLGDLMDDLAIVGGLVPSLIINQENIPDGGSAHVGTMDLDVGLTVALLSEGRYRTLSEALRSAGFEPDLNEQGNLTRQRWRMKGVQSVTIDFLISPSLPDDKERRIRNIEPDFAAFITPGLHLAFRDREKIELSGKTILGEQAKRSIWVCGPGAYVVLKALAFEGRGENKDAYDLFYLLQNYGSGVEDIVKHLQILRDDEITIQALKILQRDFLEHDAIGPRRVANFLTGGPDDAIQADVVGLVAKLLQLFPL